MCKNLDINRMQFKGDLKFIYLSSSKEVLTNIMKSYKVNFLQHMRSKCEHYRIHGKKTDDRVFKTNYIKTIPNVLPIIKQ